MCCSVLGYNSPVCVKISASTGYETACGKTPSCRCIAYASACCTSTRVVKSHTWKSPAQVASAAFSSRRIGPSQSIVRNWLLSSSDIRLSISWPGVITQPISIHNFQRSLKKYLILLELHNIRSTFDEALSKVVQCCIYEGFEGFEYV